MTLDKYNSGEFPRRIEIELASACNLRCTYCPRQHLDPMTGVMSFDLFKKIIDEASAYPETKIVLHRRGESLLNPNLIKILRYIAGKFREIQMATNATLLDKERSEAIIEALDFISFSLDTPERFDLTRVPAVYEEVEKNILNFLQMNRGKVRTQASMVKTEETPESASERFKDIWRSRVDRVRIYEEHSKDGQFGSLTRNRGKRKTCVMPFYEILIYDDGKVARCNHDWDTKTMGNISDLTIKELWKSPQYSKLREQHLALKIEDPVCQGCDSWYPEIGKQCTGETEEDG